MIFFNYSSKSGWDNVIDIVTIIILAVTAIIGLWTYLRSKRVDRMNVLLGLHRRFMETGRYSLVRMKIERSEKDLLDMVDYVADYPNVSFENIVNQDPKLSFYPNAQLMANFDEYLGFFELLAHLQKEVGFSIKDIKGIFGYYIIRLKNVPQIWKYLNVGQFHFRITRELVEKVSQLKER